jgi:hypothetical protein
MSLIMARFITDNGPKMVSEKGKEFSYGKTAVSIKGIGKTIRLTGMDG